jgi:MoxR-like ATPase
MTTATLNTKANAMTNSPATGNVQADEFLKQHDIERANVLANDTSLPDSHELTTLRDIVQKLRRHGALTVKQVNFVRVLIDKIDSKSTSTSSTQPQALTQTEATQLAIRICNLLDTSYWRTTPAIVNALGKKDQYVGIRDTLKALQAANVVERRGTGKFNWRLTSSAWNRENPFKSSTSTQTQATPAPVAQQTSSIDNTQLAAMMRQSDEQFAKLLEHNKSLNAAVAALVTITSEQKQQIEALQQQQPKQVVLSSTSKKTKAITIERTHEAFEEVLRLANRRQNVLLIGPAGCGKSVLASQIATALELPFYSISCSIGMSEGQITGRLLPHERTPAQYKEAIASMTKQKFSRGEAIQLIAGGASAFHFCETSFIKAYEQGGVFLLDELDACDPNVLLVINQAIASDSMPLPNRVENPVAKKHEDFVLLAAANTFGRGADRLYVGRSQLDESTLDRFRIGQVCLDYDSNLESQICSSVELLDRVRVIRQRCVENRMERIVSTRFLAESEKALADGESIAYVLEKLTAGWSASEKAKAGVN